MKIMSLKSNHRGIFWIRINKKYLDEFLNKPAFCILTDWFCNDMSTNWFAVKGVEHTYIFSAKSHRLSKRKPEINVLHTYTQDRLQYEVSRTNNKSKTEIAQNTFDPTSVQNIRLIWGVQVLCNVNRKPLNW